MTAVAAAKAEVQTKLATVRCALHAAGFAAARFRGVDWFAWCTGGGFGGVLMTSETSIADLLITDDHAWILTDVIEKQRLADEVVTGDFEVLGFPWQSSWMREEFVAYKCPAGVCSDRPGTGERPLPDELLAARRTLAAEEMARYRSLGSDAANAITDAAQHASPELTEWELAGQIAHQLRRRGIDPALIQVGGAKRVEKYRHVLPTCERLGARAMMAICARRHGLYASLTRFVHFGQPTEAERKMYEAVAHIEAVALGESVPGTALAHIYHQLARAYRDAGFADQVHRHHQGGTAGYLAREELARPECASVLSEACAVTWNPSLPGSKIEDTFLCTGQGLELLTLDPRWPTFECAGRMRPAVMVLT